MKKTIFYVLFLVLSTQLTSCASRYQMIGAGMLGGAVTGAGAGYLFVHHGENKQYEVRNTIITSAIFALLTGGIMALHYRSLEQQRIDISGEYARYRLCDPEQGESSILRQGDRSTSFTYSLTKDMIKKESLDLDETTKWVFPVFRKRYLPPDQGPDSVTSSRFMWEVIKPGHFVTKERNPEFFLEIQELNNENKREGVSNETAPK